MGPLATAAFYTMLTKFEVTQEQDYPDVLIHSIPSIPDRTAFIIGKSSNDPTGALIKAAKGLENAGAKFIAIPCVTAHYFYNNIAAALKIPLINLPVDLAKLARSKGIKKIGLLATSGTIQSNVLQSAFEKEEIKCLTLPSKQQSELMDTIYSIKQGKKSTSIFHLEKHLKTRGADAVILGCTELSLIAKPAVKRIDALTELAGICLKRIGK